MEDVSDNSLKRKAHDIEIDDTDHASSLTNGRSTTAKRHKITGLTPPTSNSSNGSRSPEPLECAMDQAQRFKNYWNSYAKLYQEVSNQPGASQEQIDTVLKMHQRLIEMKDDITSSLNTV